MSGHGGHEGMRHSIFISLVAFFICELQIHAQVQNAHQDWMTWDGNRVVWEEATTPPTLRFESPERQGDSIPRLIGPEGSLGLEFKDGAAWASVRGSADHPKATYLYRSLNLKTWEVNATYLGEQGRAVGIYHLDGKRYFMTSGVQGFSCQEKCSPFAIAEINDKGYLVIKDLVSLNLKEPLVFPAPTTAGGPKGQGEFNPKYSALMAVLFLNPMIRYPGGLALVAQRPGYIWLFDDQSGALKRSIRLFSGVTEEKLGPPQELEWAILGCQPRTNGHLLIASREEDAVLFSRASFPTYKNLKYINDEAQHKLDHEQDAASLQHWPRILWWDIDPKTGSIAEEQPPQKVPRNICDFRVFRNFKFRFKPDGNLHIN